MNRPTKTRLLFIGNSATYVHNVPETLAALATEAGFPTEAVRITKGGFTLAQHADAACEHGQVVLARIKEGFDVVFLQDNGNCISNDEKRAAAKHACRTLGAAIQETGASVRIYVRPPYGYDIFGRSPVEQCMELDRLFGEIAQEIGAVCSYANRAFAYALTNGGELSLYGPDNAHTSPEGAYLIVCTLFSSLYRTSSTVLADHGLDPDVARRLQQIADKIALENRIPW